MTLQEATDYIKAHDAAAIRYTRMPKYELAMILRARHNYVIGQPEKWSKDELVNELMNEDYPLAQVNEAHKARYEARLDGAGR